MAAPARLPWCSEPAVAREAPAATHEFGFMWQEVTTRVEAFAIEASDKIVQVESVTHDVPRTRLVQRTQSLTRHLLILHPGEYVTKAEVSVSDQAVTALRLHTSKRVTPWFGETVERRETFEADEGFCINAFQGMFGPDGCSELGVVYAPNEIAREGHSIVVPNVTLVMADLVGDTTVGGDDTHGDGAAHTAEEFDYRTLDLAPRAIVVETGESAIQNVRVVTAVEYDRIVRFPDSFRHGIGVQWFVLTEHERVEEVRVQAEEDRLTAIQFNTNLQTSQIFGNSGSKEQSLAPDPDSGSYVCGFALDVDGNDDDDEDAWISRFAILCSAPVVPATTSRQTSKTPSVKRARE